MDTYMNIVFAVALTIMVIFLGLLAFLIGSEIIQHGVYCH